VFDFSGETHPGRVRSNNEDAIGWLIREELWLVADGMGGYSSGELASRIVKETILKNASAHPDSLRPVILRAHEAILASAAEESQRYGMGSTIVLAKVDGRRCRVEWCGDSRAYLWRAGKLSRISRDHSFLEHLIELGELQPEDAHKHPRSRELTQGLGIGDPSPDATDFWIKSNDWVLLCTDGLHDELTDDEIAAVLAASSSPNEATQNLIAETLEHDAEDNVSAIVIKFPAYPDEDESLNAEEKQQNTVIRFDSDKSTNRPLKIRKLLWLAMTAVLALVAALLIYSRWIVRS
jgi:protein phosphatase